MNTYLEDRIKAFILSLTVSSLSLFFLLKLPLALVAYKESKPQYIQVKLLELPQENTKKITKEPTKTTKTEKFIRKEPSKSQATEKPKLTPIQNPLIKSPIEELNEREEEIKEQKQEQAIQSPSEKTGIKEDKANPKLEQSHKPEKEETSPPTKPNKDPFAEYLLKVKRLIEAKKVYPEEAKRYGVEGKVTLRLTLDRDGRLKNLQVVRSSGSFILDREAQKLISSLKFPPLPSGEEYTFQVVIEYKLED
ncbi:MAG: TonB family protein [Hydrogenobacter sp.]